MNLQNSKFDRFAPKTGVISLVNSITTEGTTLRTFESLKDCSSLGERIFDNKIFLVANDFASALGYSRANDAVSKHCTKRGLTVSLGEYFDLKMDKKGGKSVHDKTSWTDEAHKTMVSQLQKQFTNSWRSTKLIQEDGMLWLLSRSRKLPTQKKEAIIKYFKLGDKVVLESRREIEFIHKLKKVIEPIGIEVVTQLQVERYRVDIYFPKFNIVVEFDENGHVNYDEDNERKREKVIKKELNCAIVRIDDRDDDLFNIGCILKKLGKF